jgi:hypothetical protein
MQIQNRIKRKWIGSRIKVEGMQETCIKSFEGGRQGVGGNTSSRALKGSGEGGMHPQEHRREAGGMYQEH